MTYGPEVFMINVDLRSEDLLALLRIFFLEMLTDLTMIKNHLKSVPEIICNALKKT